MKFKAKTKDYQLIVRAKASFGESINEHDIDLFIQKNPKGFMKARKIKKGVVDYVGPIAVPLFDALQKPVTTYDFFLIIEQLVDAVRNLQKSSLVINRIVMDMKNIYINETTKEMWLMYLPVESNKHPSSLSELLQSIIYTAKPADSKDAERISKFAYFIKSMSGYNGDKIEAYIEKVDRRIVALIKNVTNGKSGFLTDDRREYMEHYENEQSNGKTTGKGTDIYYNHVDDDIGTQPLSALQDYDDDDDIGTQPLSALQTYDDDDDIGTQPLSALQTNYDDYEDEATGLLVEEDEATGLLNENAVYPSYPMLVREKTGESVTINKPVYRVGKEKSYVDFFIGDNIMISRSHLDIISRNGRYFVKDLGSKNKTYVNGIISIAERETEIFDGDVIRMADEYFTFKYN